MDFVMGMGLVTAGLDTSAHILSISSAGLPAQEVVSTVNVLLQTPAHVMLDILAIFLTALFVTPPVFHLV
jgi:hypothetical protein